jgi:hypothetical protein
MNPCYHGMLGPHVTDRRQDLQMWKVDVNIFSKRSRTGAPLGDSGVIRTSMQQNAFGHLVANQRQR